MVSVIKDGLVEKRQVVAGAFSIDGRRVVSSGLRAGETIMTKSGVFYRSGDAVKTIGSSIGSSTAVHNEYVHMGDSSAGSHNRYVFGPLRHRDGQLWALASDTLSQY